MNEQRKFLNEENYQNTKKKLTNISLAVLIIGVVIGLGLIITGIILSNNAKSISIDLNNTENNIVSRTEDEVQNDINIIKTKINSLKNEISTLEMDLFKIQFEERSSNNYYEKQDEKEKKEAELLALNTQLEKYQKELHEINSNSIIDDMAPGLGIVENIFNTASNNITKAKYTPFYIFGAFIIIASGMISLVIFLYAKRRDMIAFGAQSVVPVAKEVVDDVAPTIGKAGATIAKEMAPAYGNIAKEISKGIKEGINEANNNDLKD